MRERINEMLRQLEAEYNSRALFACESGSRAWGFASPDSDYDVRFIFTHGRAWHLRLEKRRDTIECSTPDNLDISGWELAKMLRLFAGCNLALNEWLGSPIVYEAQASFAEELRALLPHYFNARKGTFHYLSIAGSMADAEIRDGRVKIKKLFYVIRPLLAACWIRDRGSMPPTLFRNLLEQELPEPLRAEIAELLRRKVDAMEAEPVALPHTMAAWIPATRDALNTQAANLPTGERTEWEALNEFFLRWIDGPS